MTAETLEDRMIAVETELAQLKQRLAGEKTANVTHPWERIFGSFAKSEGFDEAVRLGREYRESLRPDEHSEQGQAVTEEVA